MGCVSVVRMRSREHSEPLAGSATSLFTLAHDPGLRDAVWYISIQSPQPFPSELTDVPTSSEKGGVVEGVEKTAEVISSQCDDTVRCAKGDLKEC